MRTFGGAERCLVEERLLHHLNAFGEKPGDPQKRPHGDRHAGDATALFHVQRPADRGADVCLVGTVLLDRWIRIAPQRRLGGDDDALEVVGVRPPESLRLPERIQLFQREVADDLQHCEAWLSVQRVLGTNKALVQQRRDTVQNRRRGVVGTHRFRCLQRKAGGKHTQPGEQPAFGVVEEIVTPGDGGA